MKLFDEVRGRRTVRLLEAKQTQLLESSAAADAIVANAKGSSRMKKEQKKAAEATKEEVKAKVRF
jgi:hypothetical protein